VKVVAEVEDATCLKSRERRRRRLMELVAYAGPEELLPDQLSVVRT
jgi:hypothetical protein